MNWRKYTPLYEKDTKQNQNSPIETTSFVNQATLPPSPVPILKRSYIVSQKFYQKKLAT